MGQNKKDSIKLSLSSNQSELDAKQQRIWDNLQDVESIPTQVFYNAIKAKAICVQLSREACVLICKQVLNRKSVVQIRLAKTPDSEDLEQEWYEIISTRVANIKNHQGHTFLIELHFRQYVHPEQGVPRILNPELFIAKTIRKPPCTLSSLIPRYVVCPLCQSENVVYWKLRVKSILTGQNIFGIPVYLKAIKDFDFCNYNFLRVLVCPQCLFATDSWFLFKKDYQDIPSIRWESYLQAFTKKWTGQYSQRESQIQGIQENLFSDQRDLQSAVCAYQFAIEAHTLCFELSQNIKEKRKLIFLLLIRAELFMEQGSKKEAEADLRTTLNLLKEILPELNPASYMRATLLVALIHLYFQELEKFGEYMTFLVNFNHDHRIHPASAVGKVFRSCMDRLNQAYEDKESFNSKTLKSFRM